MTGFTDFNILNRATFSNKPIVVNIRVSPSLYEGTVSHQLGESVFWVKDISWKMGYFDVGMFGAQQTDLKPIQVSVTGGTDKPLLDAAEEPTGIFSPPIPVAGRLDFAVKNTNIGNNHELRVKFYLKGILVTPKPGQEPLTLKEMMGYIMLDDNRKGELAFAEAVVDSLDEKMIGMGMESIRKSLPHGLGAVNALPEPLQRALLKNNPEMLGLPGGFNGAVGVDGQPAAIAQQQPLALPMVDPEKERSTFMGDLIDTCELTPDQIKLISEKMIEKGWRRI